MSQQTQPAQQAPKLEMRPTTVFLVIDDSFERKIAMAYLEAKFPGTQARKYAQLPLNRLRREDVVIAVLRPEKRKPALRVVKNEHGIRETTDVPISEIDDVFLSKPLDMESFWREGADGYDGDLNHNAFLCALGPLIGPARIVYNEKSLPGYMSITL